MVSHLSVLQKSKWFKTQFKPLMAETCQPCILVLEDMESITINCQELVNQERMSNGLFFRVNIGALGSVKCFDTVGWATGRTSDLYRPTPLTQKRKKFQGPSPVCCNCGEETQTECSSYARTHGEPFYSHLSGTTQVSRCQKKSSSGLLWCKAGYWRQTHRQSWVPLHPD